MHRLPCCVRLLFGGIIVLLSALPDAAHAAAKAPRPGNGHPVVIVSIPPLHSLVAGVMEGTGSAPHLLFPATMSPHAAGLRPSQIRRLNKADLVVWVGPALEAGLVPITRTVLPREASFEVAKVEGLTVWPRRAPGVWDLREAMHFHTHSTLPDEFGDAGAMDPHLWLDPRNAQLMVWAIADRLAALIPEHELRYQANAQAIVTRLSQMDSILYDYLRPLRERPYIILHDAYQYAEHRYGLFARASITLDPSSRPGAGTVASIRQLIRHTGAVCLFHEPQFEPESVALLTEDLRIKTATLDPLGTQFEPGPGLYARMMAHYSEALAGCLGPARIAAAD